MSDITSESEFVVTIHPPKSRRKGGPGRPRTNPFDEPMRRSYDERFWEESEEHPEGRWFEVPETMVQERGIETVTGQIRNAGQYLDIRSEIRQDPDRLRVAFRGTPKVPKQRDGNERETDSDETNNYEANADQAYA